MAQVEGQEAKTILSAVSSERLIASEVTPYMRVLPPGTNDSVESTGAMHVYF